MSYNKDERFDDEDRDQERDESQPDDDDDDDRNNSQDDDDGEEDSNADDIDGEGDDDRLSRDPRDDEFMENNSGQYGYNDPNQKKPKIRPLPEKGEVPTDKDELIVYLKNRLDAAEDTINDSIAAIQKQKDKRKKLAQELEQKNQELVELRNQEAQTLTEKVQNELKRTLEQAIEDKVRAEDEKVEIQNMLIEREMLIQELDDNVRRLHMESSEKNKLLDEQVYKINEQYSYIESLNQKIEQLENDNQQKDNHINDLSKELAEYKGLIEKMTDVKNVLNRVLNPDNMGTLRQSYQGQSTQQQQQQQQYQQSQQMHPGDSLNHSLEMKNNQMNNSRLANTIDQDANLDPGKYKKPNYLTNEDDFWYANPLDNKEYGQDFGGRGKNYNEAYNYGKNNQTISYPDKYANPQADNMGNNYQGGQYSNTGKYQPQQPNVYGYDNRASRKNNPNASSQSRTKLPKITGPKGEVIYKADQYLEDYQNNPKVKNQNYKKRY